MRLNSTNIFYFIRQQSLKDEEQIYNSMPGGNFVLEKQNGNNFYVWTGMLANAKLRNKYKIRIEYGLYYPFMPPKVYPLDKTINNNLHQNISTNDLPGDICLYSEGINHWQPNIKCEDIIDRVVEWFNLYEKGKLCDIPAPPEIDRYYPVEYKCDDSGFFVINFINNEVKPCGESYWVRVKDKSVVAVGAAVTEQNEDQIGLNTKSIIKNVFDIEYAKQKDNLIFWFGVCKYPIRPYLKNLNELVSFIKTNSVSDEEKANLDNLWQYILDNKQIYIGLNYKTGDGEIKWIFYKHLNKLPPMNNGIINGFRKVTQNKYFVKYIQEGKIGLIVPNQIDKKTIFKRVDNEDFKTLDQSNVLIIGCGTIGSKISEYLVKSGLGSITLIDNDNLVVGNVCRHVLGLNYVGQNKAEALKKYLLNINPFLKIEAYAKDVMCCNDMLAAKIENFNIIISCTAKDNVDHWLNLCFIDYNVALAYTRTYPLALIGDILITAKNNYCLNCFCEELSKKEKSVLPQFPEYKVEEAYKYDNDCGSPYIPASAIDIDYFTLNFSKIIINYLGYSRNLATNF